MITGRGDERLSATTTRALSGAALWRSAFSPDGDAALWAVLLGIALVIGAMLAARSLVW